MAHKSKDPAVLLYTNDFLSGTFTMSDEQVGKYMRLLCIQHQKGFLLEKDMLNICKSYDEDVYSKFVIRDGLYINERMESEAEKRKLYSKSRSDNRLGKGKKEGKKEGTYVNHMEDVIIDINNITYEHKKFFLKKDKSYSSDEIFGIFWGIYPNKDGKKQAVKHFNASVKSIEDIYDLDKAILNYLKSDKVLAGYIKNGSTFFNNWQDFIKAEDFQPQKEKQYSYEEYRDCFGELAENE